jgi:DNA-binding GntR family transcriptional regulator
VFLFPSHSPEQLAVARQLSDELACYSAGLNLLLERRWDPALYREVSDQFDRMQMHAQALPQLVRCWSDLLVSRVELTQALWESRSPSRNDGPVIVLHAQHERLIQELRGICRGYLAD